MDAPRVEELLDMFHQRAPISQFFGMRLSFSDEGSAIVDLPYNPHLDHPLGGIHGGVYATLLDVAGWFTAAAVHEVSCWLATSELTVHYLEPVKRKSLRAIGTLIKQGKRQDIVEAKLYDEERRLVGHAIGTFMILPSVGTDATDAL